LVKILENVIQVPLDSCFYLKQKKKDELKSTTNYCL